MLKKFSFRVLLSENYISELTNQSKSQENIVRIDEFALSNTVLSCDTETAKRYGDIKTRLKDKGQPIPENDIWIAAIAQQYTITLVTKDTHFDAIENVKIEAW